MIFLCVFFSGVSSLVYGLVWLRVLALIFGHTVSATTTVLAAILAGLGLGGVVIGRIADRRPAPVVLYGVLACAAGVWGALIPSLLPAFARVYLGLGVSHDGFGLIRFGFVLLLLLPATAAIGGMLPLLGRAVGGGAAGVASRVGRLWAVNTFGAALGAAAAGYVSLPALGATATVYVAAALNVAVGLAAAVVGLRAAGAGAARFEPGGAGGTRGPSATPGPSEGETAPQPPVAPVLWGAIGLGAAAAMVYGLAWVRVLALIIGNSTYAFTAVLVAALAGLAIGSAASAGLPSTVVSRPRTLAGMLAAVAIGAIAMIPTFDRFPGLVARAFSLSSEPAFVLSVQVVLSALLLLPPTALIGAAVPCAVGALVRDADRIGRDVGRLYAVGAGGAIIGMATAGTALIPGVGVENAIKVGAILHVLAAAAVLAGSIGAPRAWRRVLAPALVAAVAAGALLVPSWNRSVMGSGVAIYGAEYGRVIDKISLADVMRTRRQLFYEEGLTATVTVQEFGYRYLGADGRTEAGTGPRVHTELLSGHLPLLVHPSPRRVLVIGLGSGVAVGAIARHPVDRIDVVEIEPAITRAARLFDRESRNALDDSRARVTIADPRSFLLTRPDRYDVIVSEPSHPGIGRLATLFSSEFYALAAGRLAPGGLMLQRVDGSAMAPADLRMVARTFRAVFPSTSAWTAAPGDYLLMGGMVPGPLPIERVAARYAENADVREDFRRSGLVSAEALLADFVLGELETAKYAEGAGVNTDDRVPLQFSAARSLWSDTTAENWRLIREFRSPVLPPALDRAGVHHAIGVAYVAKNLPDEALVEFDRALLLAPGHVPSLFERGRLLRATRKPAEALASLELAAKLDPKNAEVQYEIGLARETHAGPAAALDAFGRAVALAPPRVDFLRAYATALAQTGRASEAVAYLLLARAMRPRDPALMDLVAFVYLQAGNTARAVELLGQAVAAAPDAAVYHFRLGQAHIQNRNPDAALEELRRAVLLRPDFIEAHLELANTYLITDQVGPAMAAYRRVLALDPRNAMASRILTTLQR